MKKANVILIVISMLLLSQLMAQTSPSDSSEAPSPSSSEHIQASLSKLIDYQGFISGSQGQPISGTVSITFGIWDAAQAGNELWSETQTLDVHLGYFTAHLGGISEFPNSLFASDSRWIQLQVNGETLAPRKRIHSVANALYSDHSKTLSGYSIADFYTRVQANDHSKNEIDASRLGGSVASQFVTQTQGDSRYVVKGIPGTVTGTMIVDGTIQKQDLAFEVGSGSGSITRIVPDVGLEGGGSSGEVFIGLTPVFETGQAYDNRFVKLGQQNAITSAMIGDGAVTSIDIKDGGIQQQDLAFTAGTINQVVAENGLSGGGTMGSVTLSLAESYRSGLAYDGRFVNLNQANSITTGMLRDNEITSVDIRDGTIQPQDMSFSAGDVTAVTTYNGLEGGGTQGDLRIGLQSAHFTGAAFDSRFINAQEPSSITSNMIANGTIQQEDLSFPVGDITSVWTSGGIVGGGLSGDLNLQLESSYATGSAYNSVFVNENQSDAITSIMIRDSEVRSSDIAAGSVTGSHIANDFYVQQSRSSGAVMAVNNQSSATGSYGIEGRGTTGLRGVGNNTGVYGEGSQYGVYAKSTNSSNWALYVEGRAHCTSGDWGDLAEFVPATEPLEPGDVVIIDSRSENSLRKCDKAYDTRVAGIVSTAPTITVGAQSQGAGRVPLALAGIVPCNVTGEAIIPGDLLTSSDVPGYAQKASSPLIGTIIGKALESFSGGEGVIKVLVTLQ